MRKNQKNLEVARGAVSHVLAAVSCRLAAHVRTCLKDICVIWLAVTSCHLLFLARGGFWEDVACMLMAATVEVGILAFLAAWAGRWARTIYVVAFILASVDFALDFGNYLCMGELFSMDSFLLMMGTNTQEVSDFVGSYFPLPRMLQWLAALLALYAIFFSSRPRGKISAASARRLAQLGFLLWLFCCGTLLGWRQPQTLATIFPGKWAYMASLYEPVSDLGQYRHQVPLAATTEAHPSRIVLIIGESFSKSHSSLYGYERPTNPLLATLRQSGNLYTFTRCESPTTRTSPAFKCIMSTYREDGGNMRKWYDCETLNDIFQPAYTMYWVTNQKSVGAYESIQSDYARLCDSVWFSNVETGQMNCYDEVLIPVLRSLLPETQGKSTFTIVNLMGQHEDFQQRYPPQFGARFTPDDYAQYPKHQRPVLAHYDNATLYNDSIVYSILRLYEQEEIVAFYFPDHGLDIFDTDAHFAGHARKTDPKSVALSCQIPFLIYLSDTYKRTHLTLVRRIESTLDRPFNTQDFIYTIMDVAGYRFAHNDDVEKHSLFGGAAW